MVRGADRGDLNRLYRAAIEAAIGRIEKDGHFQPLVFELRGNGTVQNVAVLDMAATDGRLSVLERLADLLRPRIRDGIARAVAVVRHTRDGRRIDVRLRARDYSADIAVPYSAASTGVLRRRRHVRLGPAQERAVPNDLFR